ncbi:MAG: DinB family protein [Desulfobacterales bacterium]
MSQRAKDIAKRIESFRDEVGAFVENLSDEEWNKECDAEDWSVGVTARHVGAGHLALSGLIGKMARGEELPQLSMDQINAMSEKDARAHADATKAEVLEHLRKNGDELVDFVAGLSDDDLGRQAGMPAFGGAVSAELFIDYVIFQSAAQHFESMKKAVTE